MAKSGAPRPFEVYCDQCNVSLPAGARHCVHCGGRLSRNSATTGSRLSRQLAVAETEEIVPFEGEEEAPRRSPFSPVALIWVVLLAVGSIYRACTGE